MKKHVILIGLAVVFSLLGCGKKEAAADASKPLTQSFQSAEPEVQQAVNSAVANLNAKNYNEAARALNPVITSRPLNEQQREAVAEALKQLNQAITANPSLDTKELYEMRQKMFMATMRRWSLIAELAISPREGARLGVLL